MNEITTDKIAHFCNQAQSRGFILSEPGTVDRVCENERNKILNDAIESLPERHASMLKMRFFELVSYTDIAKMLGLSKQTVKKTESRALRLMRSERRLKMLREVF